MPAKGHRAETCGLGHPRTPDNVDSSRTCKKCRRVRQNRNRRSPKRLTSDARYQVSDKGKARDARNRAAHGETRHAWRNSLAGLASQWKSNAKRRGTQLAIERTSIQDKLLALEQEEEECRRYLEQVTQRKSSVPASSTPQSSGRSDGWRIAWRTSTGN